MMACDGTKCSTSHYSSKTPYNILKLLQNSVGPPISLFIKTNNNDTMGMEAIFKVNSQYANSLKTHSNIRNDVKKIWISTQ